jgi:hypothetical protein
VNWNKFFGGLKPKRPTGDVQAGQPLMPQPVMDEEAVLFDRYQAMATAFTARIEGRLTEGPQMDMYRQQRIVSYLMELEKDEAAKFNPRHVIPAEWEAFAKGRRDGLTAKEREALSMEFEKPMFSGKKQSYTDSMNHLDAFLKRKNLTSAI